MKTKWISIKRLKMHEVDTTIRLMSGSEITWLSRSNLYGSIQAKALKSFGQLAVQLLIAYLIASSLRSGTTISVKLASFEASIPASFFLLAVSFFFLLGSIAFNHLSTAMSLKISLAKRAFPPGFSVSAHDLLQDRGDNILGIPQISNRFLREVLPVSRVLGFLLMLAVFSGLIPFVALGIYLLDEQFALFQTSQINIFERFSAFAGMALTCASGLFVALFHFPIPFKKNVEAIRWGFLYRLPSHPSDDEKFDRWLEEK